MTEYNQLTREVSDHFKNGDWKWIADNWDKLKLIDQVQLMKVGMKILQMIYPEATGVYCPYVPLYVTPPIKLDKEM